MIIGPNSRNRVFNMRLTEDEATQLHALARKSGFGSTSAYLRALIEGQSTPAKEKSSRREKLEQPTLFYKTALGKIYHGDSRGLLGRTVKANSVDLIITSPPFGLVRKKAYGNPPSDKYLEWFRPFAEGMRKVLKDNGSLVIDIGPAWMAGLPTKSTYQFELLLMLCKEFDFHLAQDFYWWNPCRLPAPAEWVNVRRIRAKDSVNPVWWLSPTPWPKASNRRVLTPYGKDQEKLFHKGYNPGRRPSGHIVSKKWGRNNGGAVPPNLIAAPNTVSGDPYQVYCRKMGLQPHPARFPWGLPEFFIRMLTDPKDLVIDPFGGSCLTGSVAESLGRRWVCGELEEEYLLGALGRFKDDDTSKAPSTPKAGYRVPTVATANASDADPLLPCGGMNARSSRRPHSSSESTPSSTTTTPRNLS